MGIDASASGLVGETVVLGAAGLAQHMLLEANAAATRTDIINGGIIVKWEGWCRGSLVAMIPAG